VKPTPFGRVKVIFLSLSISNLRLWILWAQKQNLGFNVRFPVSPHKYPYIQFSILLNAIIISLGSVKYSLSVISPISFIFTIKKSSLRHISFLCRLNCLVSSLFLVVIPCLCNFESSLHLVAVSSFICLFRV
jgi:hypothetical protein